MNRKEVAYILEQVMISMLNSVVFDPLHCYEDEDNLQEDYTLVDFCKKLKGGRGVESFGWFSMASIRSLDCKKLNTYLQSVSRADFS